VKTFPHEEFEVALALTLAYSATYFTREEYSPRGCCDDCVCLGNSASSSSTEEEEETTEQQVAAETSQGASSSNATIGAGGSLTGPNSRDTYTIGGRVSGGGEESIDIESDDPAALTAMQTVSVAALAANEQTSAQALSDVGGVASESIQAGAAESVANDSFGEAALQAASDAESTDTTALEEEAANFAAGESATATNSLAAAENEVLAGITPGQEFQASGINTTAGGSVSWWTWLGIGAMAALVAWLIARKKTA
jgi:hypothetical protein